MPVTDPVLARKILEARAKLIAGSRRKKAKPSFDDGAKGDPFTPAISLSPEEERNYYDRINDGESHDDALFRITQRRPPRPQVPVRPYSGKTFEQGEPVGEPTWYEKTSEFIDRQIAPEGAPEYLKDINRTIYGFLPPAFVAEAGRQITEGRNPVTNFIPDIASGFNESLSRVGRAVNPFHPEQREALQEIGDKPASTLAGAVMPFAIGAGGVKGAQTYAKRPIATGTGRIFKNAEQYKDAIGPKAKPGFRPRLERPQGGVTKSIPKSDITLSSEITPPLNVTLGTEIRKLEQGGYAPVRPPIQMQPTGVREPLQIPFGDPARPVAPEFGPPSRPISTGAPQVIRRSPEPPRGIQALPPLEQEIASTPNIVRGQVKGGRVTRPIPPPPVKETLKTATSPVPPVKATPAETAPATPPPTTKTSFKVGDSVKYRGKDTAVERINPDGTYSVKGSTDKIGGKVLEAHQKPVSVKPKFQRMNSGLSEEGITSDISGAGLPKPGRPELLHSGIDWGSEGKKVLDYVLDEVAGGRIGKTVDEVATKIAERYKQLGVVLPPPETRRQAETVLARTMSFEQTGVSKLQNLPSEPLPKYAGGNSINLERLGVDNDVKAVIDEVAKGVPKTKKSWAEIEADAKDLGLDMKSLKSEYDKDPTAFSTRVAAARQLVVDKSKEFTGIIAKLPNDPAQYSQEMIGDIMLSMYRYRDLIDNVQGIASDAGRALGYSRKVLNPSDAMYQLARYATEKGATPEKVADMVAALKKSMELDDVKGINKFILDMDKPNFWDYLMSYWYNNVLSGPPTHLVNSAMNTVSTGLESLSRVAMGALDVPIAKLQGRPVEFKMSEAYGAALGARIGLQRGSAKAIELIRRGETGQDSKLAYEVGSSAGAFTRSPVELLRKVAPYVELSTRVLSAEDIFFRAINFNMELASDVITQGERLGLKGKTLRAYVADKIDSPTADMMERASQRASRAIFTEQPGKVGKVFINIQNLHPTVRFIIPFARTINNLTRRGLETVPGVGIAVQSGKPPQYFIARAAQAIARETGSTTKSIIKTIANPDDVVLKRAKQLQTTDIAMKQIFGTAVAIYGVSKFINGELTADAPMDPNERKLWYASGKIPYAVEIDGKYIQYRRVEPYSTPLAAIALAGEALQRGDDKTATEKATQAAMSIVRLALNSSMMATTADLISGIERGNPNVLMNIANRAAAGFIPASGLLTSSARSIEAMRNGEATVRDPHGSKEQITARLPILSEKVPAKLDMFGRPVKLEGGWVRQYSPFKYSTPTDDVVIRELARLKHPIGSPSQKTKAGKLSDDFYRRFLGDVGQDQKTKLFNLMMSPGYVSKDDGRKNELISRITRRSIKKTRAKLGLK